MSLGNQRSNFKFILILTLLFPQYFRCGVAVLPRGLFSIFFKKIRCYLDLLLCLLLWCAEYLSVDRKKWCFTLVRTQTDFRKSIPEFHLGSQDTFVLDCFTFWMNSNHSLLPSQSWLCNGNKYLLTVGGNHESAT